ncbi:2-dehydro-3-deoxygalactonokinase [Kushneria phosphatilytica]|uniref:2-dehydro-3-deoxygalactonokinase n=1 Tax=Kushneria phosphatilytica TaxID=657387 RepID=A0A1S1NSZ4_9GAMM|nr:2-dehydro-3-deoxygalactonokinase [Kushneria phosphatilytica]OHV08723.1 2-keto-3-deoxy-galactonokinase [Kushneria phosphatilytica]QEL12447.1 2-dehydro-3-deoxygalactonokinase [Kushneria phosphatilytica]
MSRQPRLMAVDWGTSSLRAWLLDDQGEIIDSRAEPWGIQQVPDGDFASAWRRIAGDWREHYPEVPALACGMIGSRGGWREVPYVDCPAAPEELAEGLVEFDTGTGPLTLVPGIMQHSDAATATLPNVMRGEETQVLGALERQPALRNEALLVMPGTHCKWVTVREGRITDFTTHMTGELFAVLREHSILGRPAREVTTEASEAVFCEGLDVARKSGCAGTSGALFSVRSRVLAGELTPEHSLEYLSGLLIGEELRSVLADRHSCPPLMLIGDDSLCQRYRLALERFGIDDVHLMADASIAGLWRIARAAGLINDREH